MGWDGIVKKQARVPVLAQQIKRHCTILSTPMPLPSSSPFPLHALSHLPHRRVNIEPYPGDGQAALPLRFRFAPIERSEYGGPILTARIGSRLELASRVRSPCGLFSRTITQRTTSSSSLTSSSGT